MPDLLKFQMLIYTTNGSCSWSCDCGICAEEIQLQQLNLQTHLENWSFLEVQGVIHNYGQEKSPSLRSDGMILLHNNVWLHMAQHTQNLLQICGWEPLDHPP